MSNTFKIYLVAVTGKFWYEWDAKNAEHEITEKENAAKNSGGVKLET